MVSVVLDNLAAGDHLVCSVSPENAASCIPRWWPKWDSRRSAQTRGKGLAMKDFTKKELEGSRPAGEPVELIDFCLGRLYRDRRRQVTDEVVRGLTFEELIGALLVARDAIGELQ